MLGTSHVLSLYTLTLGLSRGGSPPEEILGKDQRCDRAGVMPDLLLQALELGLYLGTRGIHGRFLNRESHDSVYGLEGLYGCCVGYG